MALTVAGPDLFIERSACGVTVVVALLVLLPGTGSAVVAPIEELLVIEPPCPGAVTWMLIEPLPPVTQLARVQVTEQVRRG